MNYLVPKTASNEYLNIPLNDEDFLDLLEYKTAHMPAKIEFITMCAKGYRSLIGYSLMKLISKPSWRIRVCRNQLP